MTAQRGDNKGRADGLISRTIARPWREQRDAIAAALDAAEARGRRSVGLADFLPSVSHIGPGSVVTLAGPEVPYIVGSLETAGVVAVLHLRTVDGLDWSAGR